MHQLHVQLLLLRKLTGSDMQKDGNAFHSNHNRNALLKVRVAIHINQFSASYQTRFERNIALQDWSHNPRSFITHFANMYLQLRLISFHTNMQKLFSFSPTVVMKLSEKLLSVNLLITLVFPTRESPIIRILQVISAFSFFDPMFENLLNKFALLKNKCASVTEFVCFRAE